MERIARVTDLRDWSLAETSAAAALAATNFALISANKLRTHEPSAECETSRVAVAAPSVALASESRDCVRAATLS